jgi:hypothetical protein
MTASQIDRNLRLAMRLPEIYLQVYVDVVDRGRKQTEIAEERRVSKQRIGRIVARCNAVLRYSKPATVQLIATFGAIEAEACAEAGYETIDDVIEAVDANRIPKWWPATITVAICRTLALPVPGSALRKVVDVLMELTAAVDGIQSKLRYARQLTIEQSREHSSELLRRIENESKVERARLVGELVAENPGIGGVPT